MEKDKWSGPHPQLFKIYRCEDMVDGEVSKITGNADGLFGICQRQHGLVAPCSKRWKLEAVFKMWKEPRKVGPGCLGNPCACGMTGTDAGAVLLTERRIVRERFGEHLIPLSLYQANCDIALLLSWSSAGYGWSGSYGSWYGRRRGRWSGNFEDLWFCETCRVDLWRRGAFLVLNVKVLSWNVSGDLFFFFVADFDAHLDVEIGSDWHTRAIHA